MRSISLIKLSLAALCLVMTCGIGRAQTTSFTYQGKLTDGGGPAIGAYHLQFKLYDTAAINSGTQIGATLIFNGEGGNPPAVQVTNGVFTTQLNFGAGAFPGAARFLEISVKRPTDGSYTTLSPRQEITSTPYAQRSLTAETIFIGGNRAFAVTGGLSSPNSASNTFVGVDVGGSNAPSDNTNAGNANSFFGRSAGRSNTDGSSNSFFGFRAGYNNQSGFNNSFFGSHAGLSNTSETYNTFLGNQTDGASGINFATAIGAFAKVTRSNSIVLGGINGVNGATSDTNVGIGTSAPTERLHVAGNGLFTGNLTVNGTFNATLPAGSDKYIQNHAGFPQPASFSINGNGRLDGNLNVGAGTFHVDALTSTVGIGIPSAGARLHVNGGVKTGLRVETELQSGGTVASFGGIGVFLIDAPNVSGGRLTIREFFDGGGRGASGEVGIGTNNPFYKLHVKDNFIGGLRVETATGDTVASFGGQGDFLVDANGVFGGRFTIKGSGNVGIGMNAPAAKLHVVGASSFPAIPPIAIIESSGDQIPLNFNIGATQHARIRSDNAGNLVLATLNGGGKDIYFRAGDDSGTDMFIQSSTGNVGIGTNAPSDKLEVSGVIRVNALGSAGGTQLCRNLSNQISNCSSSLRYKSNLAPFSSGLSFLKQLRPVSFDWKHGDARDVGFGAEDVAKIDPLFVTYNEKREVEGVKYDRLSVVFVNAFNEQQSQLESLKRLVETQQQQINALKKLVCVTNADAAICKQ